MQIYLARDAEPGLGFFAQSLRHTAAANHDLAAISHRCNTAKHKARRQTVDSVISTLDLMCMPAKRHFQLSTKRYFQYTYKKN